MATTTNSINNSAQVFTSATNITSTAGNITATAGNVIITSGQLVLGASSGTNGQLPISATGGNPAWATLTSTGGTISYTVGANTLNLESTVNGFTWAAVGVNGNLTNGNGAINAKAALLTMTLPATAAVGTVIGIKGTTVGVGGWLIAQNALQSIWVGSTQSTAGVGGSVASTNAHDGLTAVCVVANTTWEIIDSVGNLLVT